MTSYSETLREHARIAILRFLEDAPRYTSNVSMLAALLPQVGITISTDQIIGEVSWLEEQGMLTSERIGTGLIIVTATTRGVEVAQGIARYPGIRRPGPRGA